MAVFVKIEATDHPRLRVGYIYALDELANGCDRYTSLGGKHSVVVDYEDYFVDTVDVDEPVATPRDTHALLGERLAAQCWIRAVGNGETTDYADQLASSFRKLWAGGFFKGAV